MDKVRVEKKTFKKDLKKITAKMQQYGEAPLSGAN
jgi:hypothetical protein